MQKYAAHVFDIMSVRIISVTSSTNTGHGNEFRVEFKICDYKSKTGLLVEETEKIKILILFCTSSYLHFHSFSLLMPHQKGNLI